MRMHHLIETILTMHLEIGRHILKLINTVDFLRVFRVISLSTGRRQIANHFDSAMFARRSIDR